MDKNDLIIDEIRANLQQIEERVIAKLLEFKNTKEIKSKGEFLIKDIENLIDLNFNFWN